MSSDRQGQAAPGSREGPSSGLYLYSTLRLLFGIALGFYFRRIERFHAERVPHSGPVLFVSNHPNSLTDSFIIGASVSRKVSFVATVQLFRFKPVKWLLTKCGVIPINRVKDDPRAMRTVASTFEACFDVLEQGEAVGIFPEGITYDDSQLKEIKPGAARMALELENRHQGKLGLKIVPVGLTFSAKEIYRSDALVNFGEPIAASDFLDGYTERRKECLQRLTLEIEKRIQSLILHLPALEHEQVIAGVKRLYSDRVLHERKPLSGDLFAQKEELVLGQNIVAAVEEVYRTNPERARAFAANLDAYERWLERLKISDEHLKLFPRREKLLAQSVWWSVLAIAGAPIAVYGWLHRLLPYALIRFVVRKFTQVGRQKAQTATAAIEAGIVGFGFFYGMFILVFYRLFGWPAALWYALSLPPASLLAHYYLRELKRFAAAIRNAVVLLRAPFAARRLLQRRAELIAEIEQVHKTSFAPPAQMIPASH